MSANTAPIYTKKAHIEFTGPMTAANNTLDITSGTSYPAFTADATNGSFVDEVRLKASPANNTAATVLRVWLNTGAAITTSNTSLIGELSIPATTASATAAQAEYVYTVAKYLPAGYKLYLTLGTAPGGSGQFNGTVFGGDY